MAKRSLAAVLLVVLSASAALAGTTRNAVFKLDGTQLSGNFSQDQLDGNFVFARFNPTPLPNGTMGYDVFYEWCDMFPCVNNIEGLVPASAVTLHGGRVNVNVTLATFVQVFYTSGDPGNFIGTFTPFTGPGSSSQSLNGSETLVETNPDGSTTTLSFTGTGSDQTANFVGTLGPESVAAPLGGWNGELIVQKGTMKAVTTTP
jgi:hypothetical protein